MVCLHGCTLPCLGVGGDLMACGVLGQRCMLWVTVHWATVLCFFTLYIVSASKHVSLITANRILQRF